MTRAASASQAVGKVSSAPRPVNLSRVAGHFNDRDVADGVS